jgi:hypothetical protein
MAAKTIMVLGPNGIQKEAKVATGPIKPGHLIALNSSGNAIKHGTAAGRCPRRFAVEWSFLGTLVGTANVKDIDRPYATNDQMPYKIPEPGSEVLAWLPAAAAAIVIDDLLTSNGDGTLKKAGATDFCVAVAKEAVDNSAGGAEVRIRVEVM